MPNSQPLLSTDLRILRTQINAIMSTITIITAAVNKGIVKVGCK